MSQVHGVIDKKINKSVYLNTKDKKFSSSADQLQCKACLLTRGGVGITDRDECS